MAVSGSGSRIMSSDPSDLDESLPASFERVVATHHVDIALSSDDRRLSYRELNETANRVGHELLLRGVKLGDRIIILMRHEAALIAGMLSVLKAAGIVVVLNPTDPPVRLKQLLEDAQPVLILTDATNRQLAAETGGTNVGIVLFEECAAQGSTQNLNIRISAREIAFLVYTSGSTGRPKAVMQTHAQVFQNASRLSRALELTAEDRIGLFASLSGTQGVATTWCTLLNGANLLPFAALEDGVGTLAGWIRGQRVTVYISAASVFRHLMKNLDEGASFPAVRVVRLASETATSEDFKAFQRHFTERCRFVHTLSSSETGNLCQLRLSPSDSVAEGRLPVGRVLEGVEVVLQDGAGRNVGPGEAGEIVVRGRYLAAGYWRNEALTAEKFSEDSAEAGIRIFRTGDLARINSNGLLEFIGRKDVQLKIRGYRVEILEVEEAVRQLPDVEATAVCTVHRTNHQTQMVAYVVLRDGQSSTSALLRRALRESLPRHMLPSSFVFLDKLPLAASGKVDREKLRQIDRVEPSESPAELPQSETELTLAGIWTDVFDVASISRKDDFFDLEGDSLIAAVVSARVHDKLGVQLDLKMFADNPTLAGLARAIDDILVLGTANDLPPLVRAPSHALPSLSFFQERAWNASQTPEGLAGYTWTTSFRLLGRLDHGALRDCMSYIAGRHESLRTSFAVVDGRPAQIILPPAQVEMPFFDLADRPNAEDEAMQLLRNEAAHQFDLTSGAPMRFALVRITVNEHWLLRTAHHIIYDAWSWQVYFRELAVLYEAKTRGENPPLPERASLQYRDYATWQRSVLSADKPAFKVSAAWWKNRLSDAARVLDLPFKRVQPQSGLDPATGLICWGVDPQTSARLAQLGRTESATYYMVRLAAFVALLSAETGTPDVVLGTYVTNRRRLAVQDMFGFLVNLATLRFNFEPGMTFRKFLSIVREGVLETEANCDIPYEEMRRALESQNITPPDIQVIFSVARHRKAFDFAGLQLTKLVRPLERMPWGFSVNFDEHDEVDNCRALFDAGIYDPVPARRFIARFVSLLGAISHEPDLPMNELLTVS